jgi:hypothetical protein
MRSCVNAFMVEMQLDGEVVFGSWLDHIQSWKKAEADGCHQILFLTYEDMKRDLLGYDKRALIRTRQLNSTCILQYTQLCTTHRRAYRRGCRR